MREPIVIVIIDDVVIDDQRARDAKRRKKARTVLLVYVPYYRGMPGFEPGTFRTLIVISCVCVSRGKV